MAVKLEASVNILWQNLIALNASLANENEEQRMKLLDTKKLLQKEMETTKDLQGKNEVLKHELSVKDQLIARLSSKMVAVRQMVPPDSVDNAINPINRTTMPIIVKVESVESETSDTMDTTHSGSQNCDDSADVLPPFSVCCECEKNSFQLLD